MCWSLLDPWIVCISLFYKKKSPNHVILLVFWYIALSVTGIICFAKQFINIVQIVNASKTLANIDQEDKAKESSGKNNYG